MARICAVITANDPEAVREVEPLADLFEVRIDLIGEGWQSLVKTLRKPWIACNRLADEGGKWQGRTRTDKLVFFNGSDNCLGQLINVKIEKSGPWSVQGKLEKEIA